MSFRAEQADIFSSAFAPANASACAVEESLFALFHSRNGRRPGLKNGEDFDMAAAARKTLEKLFRKYREAEGAPSFGVEGRVLRFPVLAALRREMLVKPSGSKLIQTQDPPSETEGGHPTCF